MSGSSNVDKRQQIREQMRQFYGDPNAAGGSASRRAQDGTRRTPGVAPEMDLDSEFFNVTKYTTELLRKETLKGLVESDTELLRSVRKLDSELQELVYRNYAKFISATDTIREMRDNVSQMDTKLQALSSNVTSIDEVSQTLSDKLQEHHSRIESTITANRMLKKIQFLLELPKTMRQLLDRQEYTVCVKYWVAGDGFLTQHASIPSIATIQTECKSIAKELYATMEQAMCAVSLDDPEAMDSIRGYVENLRLVRATSLFTREQQRQDEDSTTFEEAILRVLMGSVSASFASGVVAAQREIRGALLVPSSLPIMELAKRGNALSQVGLREALAQLKSTCALLAVNSERVYSLLNKLDGSKVAMRVAQEVQPVLIDLLTPIRKQLSELAVAVFLSICDEGLILLGTPEAVAAAMQSAVASLVKQMKHIAVTLKTLSANYLDTVHSHQSHAYSAMVDQTLSEVLVAVAKALVEKAWQQPDRAAVAAMVGTHLASGNASPSALAAVASGPPNASFGSVAKSDDVATQRTAFAASRWAYASTAARLSEECATQLVQADVLAADKVVEARNALTEAAQQLLHRGIILVGQLEANAIAAAGFGNPVNAVDPTLPAAQGGGVHHALLALVRVDWPQLTAVLEALPPAISRNPKELATAAMQGGAGGLPASMLGLSNPASYTGRMFTTSSTGRSSGPRSTASPGTGARKGGRPTVRYTRREDLTLQNSVDHIFSASGAAALRTVPRDGRPGTIMGSVVVYLLKAIASYVRAESSLRSYDQHAFQRLQAHATYLLRALLSPHKGTAPRQWAKVWDDATTRAMQQQLDECCCCAYERYEAKVPLSNAALEKIVEEAAAAEVGVVPSAATTATAAPPRAISPSAAPAVAPPVSQQGQPPKEEMQERPQHRSEPTPSPVVLTQPAPALQRAQEAPAQPKPAAPTAATATTPAPAQPQPQQRQRTQQQSMGPSRSDTFRMDNDEDLPL